jgi:hypothetical protein
LPGKGSPVFYFWKKEVRRKNLTMALMVWGEMVGELGSHTGATSGKMSNLITRKDE